MLKTRVIPCLLLKGQGLVKTVRFKNPKYVGDPINAVKIFNDKEVDELVFLDITATSENMEIKFTQISEIISEAFMPLGYGGGIKTMTDIDKLFSLGVEKVIINTAAYKTPNLITVAANHYGSQSIVVSVDIKKNLFGKYSVYVNSGKQNTKEDPVKYAKKMEGSGAGEIIINSIENDGSMTGYDLHIIEKIANTVTIPVVALGGAGKMEHFVSVIKHGASAVAAGSMFVFQGIHRAVLINYPEYGGLEKLLNEAR